MRRLPVPDDVELAVTLHRDGTIGVHHATADRPEAHDALRRLAEQAANHAARVHLEGLADIEPLIRVHPPRPGRAVLACRCGLMMHAEDMRYLPTSKGSSTLVRPIVCPFCAHIACPSPDRGADRDHS